MLASTCVPHQRRYPTHLFYIVQYFLQIFPDHYKQKKDHPLWGGFHLLCCLAAGEGCRLTWLTPEKEKPGAGPGRLVGAGLYRRQRGRFTTVAPVFLALITAVAAWRIALITRPPVKGGEHHPSIHHTQGGWSTWAPGVLVGRKQTPPALPFCLACAACEQAHRAARIPNRCHRPAEAASSHWNGIVA